jgi:hypothetical protein
LVPTPFGFAKPVPAVKTPYWTGSVPIDVPASAW